MTKRRRMARVLAAGAERRAQPATHQQRRRQ
jgi:hypothetical protein